VSAEQAIADELSVAEIANHAGEWLCTSHEWMWLRNAARLLDQKMGLDYLELPADFRSIRNLFATNSLTYSARLTTMREIMARRSSITTSPLASWVALSFRRNTDGIPVPVLEIYPVSDVGHTGRFTLYYTAGWVSLVGDADYAKVPPWLEPLLIHVVREYALGYEADNAVGLMPRLEAVRNSSIWMDAITRDGESQWDLGQLEGGAMRTSNHTIFPPFTGPFPNPS
jgi:hypothetical protein